jgi:hypothetical protein
MSGQKGLIRLRIAGRGNSYTLARDPHDSHPPVNDPFLVIASPFPRARVIYLSSRRDMTRMAGGFVIERPFRGRDQVRKRGQGDIFLSLILKRCEMDRLSILRYISNYF